MFFIVFWDIMGVMKKEKPTFTKELDRVRIMVENLRTSLMLLERVMAKRLKISNSELKEDAKEAMEEMVKEWQESLKEEKKPESKIIKP